MLRASDDARYAAVARAVSNGNFPECVTSVEPRPGWEPGTPLDAAETNSITVALDHKQEQARKLKAEVLEVRCVQTQATTKFSPPRAMAGRKRWQGARCVFSLRRSRQGARGYVLEAPAADEIDPVGEA